MPEPPLIQQQRELLRRLYQFLQHRDQAETEAETQGLYYRQSLEEQLVIARQEADALQQRAQSVMQRAQPYLPAPIDLHAALPNRAALNVQGTAQKQMPQQALQTSVKQAEALLQQFLPKKERQAEGKQQQSGSGFSLWIGIGGTTVTVLITAVTVLVLGPGSPMALLIGGVIFVLGTLISIGTAWLLARQQHKQQQEALILAIRQAEYWYQRQIEQLAQQRQQQLVTAEEKRQQAHEQLEQQAWPQLASHRNDIGAWIDQYKDMLAPWKDPFWTTWTPPDTVIPVIRVVSCLPLVGASASLYPHHCRLWDIAHSCFRRVAPPVHSPSMVSSQSSCVS
ncbi:MAG: hypothetical protein HC837_17695 [Chloroflexaceae bacterium]|nr:hypothetical protein [Chloroflexaceae bacterium]